jgi:hypothetical protein
LVGLRWLVTDIAGLLLGECDEGDADEDVAQEEEGEMMAYIHVPGLGPRAFLSAKGNTEGSDRPCEGNSYLTVRAWIAISDLSDIAPA